MKYTTEILQPIVQESRSMAEVLNKLGLQLAGGNYSHIKKRFAALGIDTSHFTGQGWSRGSKRPRNDWSVVFLLHDKSDPLVKGDTLRRGLLAMGIPYVCAVCGQEPVWNGKPLVLPVDHINGKRWDNRIENLRFLCGHCHSQTDTFSGKNINRE